MVAENQSPPSGRSRTATQREQAEWEERIGGSPDTRSRFFYVDESVLQQHTFVLGLK